jgi:hypothetical protein
MWSQDYQKLSLSLQHAENKPKKVLIKKARPANAGEKKLS